MRHKNGELGSGDDASRYTKTIYSYCGMAGLHDLYPSHEQPEKRVEAGSHFGRFSCMAVLLPDNYGRPD